MRKIIYETGEVGRGREVVWPTPGGYVGVATLQVAYGVRRTNWIGWQWLPLAMASTDYTQNRFACE